MRKIYKILLAIFVAGSVSSAVSAQQKPWSLHSGNGTIITDKSVARVSFPATFKLFDLSIAPLRDALFAITGDNASRRTTVITIPNVEGNYEEFEVVEASNFEPALQARFPLIRAFSGRGITDKSATLKLSISPQGIKTMVFRTGKENEFIEPYSSDHTVYAVFNPSKSTGQLPWNCTTPDEQLEAALNTGVSLTQRVGSSTGELKTMRLAQSCNGEYSNYFGATSAANVALVLAAFNATLTRCNGVYEKDLAIHLNLIANTTDVIFYNPATDPYSSMGNWNTELQTTLTDVIGAANYDIGHMFGASGGGGNAGCIGCVCGANKGSGITSPADGIPEGDNFDIDYVVHEVGHQMGANHTFSMGLEGTGVNKEVGSGITIMGYAGITSQDVAPHSIDIYHEASIAQIQANMATKACPVTTNISANNATPVITPMSNYIIPITTPFALTGVATDANPGDVLTYCWEQDDNAPAGFSGNNSVAFATKTDGPNWLSFSPTTSPTRYFPKLSTILTGASVTGSLPGGDAIAKIEALSSIGRDLHFRLTVRDNCPYSSVAPVKVGQTAFTDVTVTVNAATGPFLITSQNSAVSYVAGTTQTVAWSVNGTTGAPINCANVKISFSSDGGLTFPTVLAASTANDGTEDITVPATITTTGRIKVEAIGNIFFDINNANITVTVPAPTFDFDSPAAVSTACSGSASSDVTLNVLSIEGYNTPVTLSATAGVPAGTSVSFGTNPVTPGSSSVVTLNNINTLAPGNYAVTITGTSGAIVKTRQITYTVTGISPNITAQPQDVTTCLGTNAVYNVTAGGTNISYQWQVSSDGGTSYNAAPDVNNAATYTAASVTTGMNNNKYRVFVTGTCVPPATSNAATLTVISPPVVTAQPDPVVICETGNVNFTSAGTGSVPTLYQWQVSSDGGANYTAVTNGGIYSGATTPTLSLTSVTPAVNNNLYRLALTNATCATPVPSAGALLTVNARPTVTLSAAPLTNLLPGQSTTITATINPNANGFDITWYKNNNVIPGITGVTYLVDSVEIGDYKVGIVNTTTGCNNESQILTIGTSASERLFIFPSPNNGQFTISYYNSTGTATQRTVAIYDMHGALVYSGKMPVTGPYTLLNINMKGVATGVYVVSIGDANGKKITKGKVFIH